jgi:hypothetical protein
MGHMTRSLFAIVSVALCDVIAAYGPVPAQPVVCSHQTMAECNQTAFLTVHDPAKTQEEKCLAVKAYEDCFQGSETGCDESIRTVWTQEYTILKQYVSLNLGYDCSSIALHPTGVKDTGSSGDSGSASSASSGMAVASSGLLYWQWLLLTMCLCTCLAGIAAGAVAYTMFGSKKTKRSRYNNQSESSEEDEDEDRDIDDEEMSQGLTQDVPEQYPDPRSQNPEGMQNYPGYEGNLQNNPTASMQAEPRYEENPAYAPNPSYAEPAVASA